MKKKGVTTGVWTLGPLNKNWIRSVNFIEPKRERYVQMRKLSSGEVAYYWCAPWWAKKRGFKIRCEPLGKDLQLANNRAILLNRFFG